MYPSIHTLLNFHLVAHSVMASFISQLCGRIPDDTAQAEDRLFSYFFRDMQGHDKDKSGGAYQIFNVNLPDGSYISTFLIRAEESAEGQDSAYVKGPPLLLLHGFGAGKSTWAPILKRLASSLKGKRDIYGIDLPGVGCSSSFLNTHEKEWTTIFAENGSIMTRDHIEYAQRLSSNALRYYTESIHAWT